MQGVGGGGGGGGASKLYLLCSNGHVQYFCRMRENTAEAWFDFYKHKICIRLATIVLLLIKNLFLLIQSSK